MSSLRNIVMLVVLVLGAVAQATTINVRRDGTGDYATIQPALDAAADGDTILIGPGEYTESTTVRPPGWAYDIQSYADLRCDNLTVIGAGADVTVIGPVSYQGNDETGGPAGLSYGGRGTLRISDLGIRHAYAMYVIGVLYMDRCLLANNTIGLSWNPSGPGGWVRDSVFEATEPIFDAMSFAIGYGGLGSGILLERCRFGRPGVLSEIQHIEVVDSEMPGIDVYDGTHVVFRRCKSTGGNVGVSQSMGGGGLCEIYDCELDGATAAVTLSSSAPGARYIIQNSRLTGGNYAVLWLGRYSGPCEIRGCDLIKGAGPVAYCEANGPVVTHDMRNNYWGTAAELTIRTWIVDINDNASIGATVLYSPFSGQSLPTEVTTWGALKSLFR